MINIKNKEIDLNDKILIDRDFYYTFFNIQISMKEIVNKEANRLLNQLVIEEYAGKAVRINPHINRVIFSLLEVLKDSDHMGTLNDSIANVISDLVKLKNTFEQKTEYGNKLSEKFDNDILQACVAISNSIYLLHLGRKIKRSSKLIHSIYCLKNLHDTIMIAYRNTRKKEYGKVV